MKKTTLRKLAKCTYRNQGRVGEWPACNFKFPRPFIDAITEAASEMHMPRNEYVFHVLRSGILFGEGVMKAPEDEASNTFFQEAFGPMMEDCFIRVLKEEGIDKFIQDKELAKEFAKESKKKY